MNGIRDVRCPSCGYLDEDVCCDNDALLPVFPAKNQPDSCLRYPVSTRQLVLADAPGRSDSGYVLRCEFGASAPFSYGQNSKTAGVLAVLFRGSPAQILQAVVAFVAVQVAALHAVWARALERLQDEAVNVPEPLSREGYFQVAASVPVRCEVLPWRVRCAPLGSSSSRSMLLTFPRVETS